MWFLYGNNLVVLQCKEASFTVSGENGDVL